MSDGATKSAQPAGSAGAAQFQQGMRALVGAVCVVAAQGADGIMAGLTATAVCSLSVDPPSLLVCVNRASGAAQHLKTGSAFSVNVLAHDQVAVAEAFGGRTAARGANRFQYGSWVRSARELPLLFGARVSFECVVDAVMDYATHHIVIGVVSDVHVRQPDAPALLYGDGQYLTNTRLLDIGHA